VIKSETAAATSAVEIVGAALLVFRFLKYGRTSSKPQPLLPCWRQDHNPRAARDIKQAVDRTRSPKTLPRG